MKIEVIRTHRETGQRVKMNAKYLSNKRRVAENDNYAIHPGDFILVKEDVTTRLDGVVSPVSKALGSLGL